MRTNKAAKRKTNKEHTFLETDRIVRRATLEKTAVRSSAVMEELERSILLISNRANISEECYTIKSRSPGPSNAVSNKNSRRSSESSNKRRVCSHKGRHRGTTSSLRTEPINSEFEQERNLNIQDLSTNEKPQSGYDPEPELRVVSHPQVTRERAEDLHVSHVGVRHRLGLLLGLIVVGVFVGFGSGGSGEEKTGVVNHGAPLNEANRGLGLG